MAVRKIIRGSHKVKRHTRTIQTPKTRKGTRRVKVKSHYTTGYNYGPAETIPAKPVISFERRFTLQYGNVPLSLINGLPATVKKFLTGTITERIQQLRDLYYKVEDYLFNAIETGINTFERSHLKFVPSNTEALRKDVMKTIRIYKQELPVQISVGAPHTDYASIVNKMKPSTAQIKHQGGLQASGVNAQYKYHAGTGDPDAQYGFIGIVTLHVRNDIKKALKQVLSVYGIPERVFGFFIKVTENARFLS